MLFLEFMFVFIFVLLFIFLLLLLLLAIIVSFLFSREEGDESIVCALNILFCKDYNVFFNFVTLCCYF